MNILLCCLWLLWEYHWDDRLIADRLGNLHIEVEVEGVVGPSEGVVGAIFVVGGVARVVAGTFHHMVLQ